MKKELTRYLLPLTVGISIAATSSMAAITTTTDDFSSNTETYPNWVSAGPTNTAFNYDGTVIGDYDDGDPAAKLAYTAGMTLTGDGISDLDGSGDGGLRLDTQDAIQANEAIGLSIGGTMTESNTISFTGSVYNDNGSFCPFSAQLWNSTDNTLLAESGFISVDGINHIAYVPKNFDVSYVVTAADEGDTLQIRFLENANSTARDVYIDNFSVTSTPPVPPDPGLQIIEWNFNTDTDPIAVDMANYDYTSDQAYVGSNAVANTLAFRGGSGGTDYWVKDKGTGHEKSLFFRTINPQGNDTGIYMQKIDFRQNDMNSTNQTRVSWSFDILGSDHVGIVPSNWTVRINYANYSQNINTSDAWFNTNNSVLAQTFDFVDDDATWTTVTGSYTIAVDDAGSVGGIQIRNPKSQGAYTSADGIYLDNIKITIETVEPDLSELYSDWAADFGLTNSPDADPDTDYDGDLLTNLEEYGLGGDPTDSADVGYIPTLHVAPDGGTNWFYYVHPENSSAVNAGLTYNLLADEDLILAPGWTNATYEILGTAQDGFGSGFNAVTNRVSTEGKNTEFIKLQIDGL